MPTNEKTDSIHVWPKEIGNGVNCYQLCHDLQYAECLSVWEVGQELGGN